jgi:glycosyltransferase involved in cell wall biosynthesis
MRILYIHAYALDNGMANCVQVLSMCKEFSKDHDIYLLSPQSEKNESEIKVFLEKNFDFPITINLLFFNKVVKNRRLSQLITYFSLNSFIEKIKPDFCFVRNSSYLRACINSKTPTFYESHNNILHPRFKLFDLFLRKMLIFSSKSSYLIKLISISNTLKDYWISQDVPKTKTLDLHSGFNTSEYENHLSKSEARILTSLPIDTKIALYTGSLSEDRKIENILFLANQNKDILFLVIGGSDKQINYYQNLSNSQGLENIEFLGHIPHNMIPNYLFSADILLALWSSEVPTINFCSPLKVFEYMAAGRLILAHSFPTIKEILVDGLNAYLANPNDLNDLDKNFKQALNDKNEKIISNMARKDAFEKYSWSVRTNIIVNEFKKYIKEK